MPNLVQAIRDAVKVYPKPCVNISGGIDSTIVLHHLSEKCKEPIYTYTVGFSGQETEFIHAGKVADYYGTVHHEILIENMLERYPEILKHFSQPRFNLWVYWAAEQASKDNRQTCYIGEGGDEHFGGYWYKPHKTYVEHWSGLFTYVYPTYQTIYNIFNIHLVVPLHPNNLSWQLTYPFFDPFHEKKLLREAYKRILPDFVLERRKLNGRKDYWVMWKNELQPYFPNATPKTEDDIRELWNAWVYREWLKVRQLEPVAPTCQH